MRRSLHNRFERQLQRMRKPRYLLALMIGIAWFVFVFFPDDRADGSQRAFAVLGNLVAPLLVALYLAWSWLWGGHRNALAFSPAEVQHLFTGPLTRRDLIHFKLVRSQAGVLFSALLFTLVIDRSPLAWWLRLPALWLLLSTIQLHQIAASLVHTSAETQGVTGVRRNAIPIALFLGTVVALLWSVFDVLPDLRAATSMDGFLATLTHSVERPLTRILLFPFRVLLGPVLAPDFAHWTRALLPAVGLLVLHYVWVVRTDAAFEEAAAEAGLRRARRSAGVRRGGRSRTDAAETRLGRPRALLFPLRPGRPASALVWKNLVAFGRGLRANTLFLLLMITLLGLISVSISVSSPERAAQGLAAAALTLAAAVVLLGPLGIRNDLRQDLARVSLLRTYPLRGWSIVSAEIASAAIVLTLAQLILIAIAFGASVYADLIGGRALIFVVVFGSAVLVLPALNGLALAIQNALALFFPEWMRIGAVDAGGVEFMGQHILRMVGSMLLLAMGLLGPLLVAASIAFPLGPLLALWSALPAAVMFIVALWAEVALIVAWLGRAFERVDPVEAGIRG
jgi:ABC-2 type transport system permease protein